MKIIVLKFTSESKKPISDKISKPIDMLRKYVKNNKAYFHFSDKVKSTTMNSSMKISRSLPSGILVHNVKKNWPKVRAKKDINALPVIGPLTVEYEHIIVVEYSGNNMLNTATYNKSMLDKDIKELKILYNKVKTLNTIIKAAKSTSAIKNLIYIVNILAVEITGVSNNNTQQTKVSNILTKLGYDSITDRSKLLDKKLPDVTIMFNNKYLKVMDQTIQDRSDWE